MPIPILLGLGVVAGVTGVAKAVGAKQKNDEAKDVNEKAKHIYDNAKSNANKARQAANEAVKNLGQHGSPALVRCRCRLFSLNFFIDAGRQADRQSSTNNQQDDKTVNADIIIVHLD